VVAAVHITQEQLHLEVQVAAVLVQQILQVQ
jgi:hypothetical protein